MCVNECLSKKVLLSFGVLIAGWPCVFYLMGWLPSPRISYIILLIILVIYVRSKQIDPLPIIIQKFFIVQISLWIGYSLLHQDASYLTRIVYLLIVYFVLCLQVIKRDKYFISLFTRWITLQAILGTIGVVLVFFNLIQPIFLFEEMDGRSGYFFGLFTTNTYFGQFSRNAGFFDEPGALACWGIFALIINKLFQNNKKIEFLLVVGLISTLSIAYFIQVFIYFWMYYKQHKGKLLLIGGVFLLLLWTIAYLDPALNDAIFGRFEYDSSTGTIAGNSREGMNERCWNVFLQAPIFGVGANNFATLSGKTGFMGSSAFVFLAEDGIIGQLVAWLPLLLIIRLGLSVDKRYLYAAIIIFAGLMQRPFDNTQLLYPLLAYTIALWAYLDVYEYGRHNYDLQRNTNTVA